MKLILAAAVAVGFVAASARAENWPSFRGPQGTGISAGKEAPLTWDAKTNVRWRVPLPDRGNSTPAVWGDRVFITQAVEKEKRRMILAFDAKIGKELWRAGVTYKDKEPTNTLNPYCTASPATDGKRVVAFFGTPGLYCYDMAGKELWHHSFGEVDSWHGSGSSPVIHGGSCYLNFGPGTQAALYAIDMKTGKVVWKAGPPKADSPRGGFRRPPGGPRPKGPAGRPPAKGEGDKPTEFEKAGRSGDFSGKGGFNGSWSTPVLRRNGGRDELLLVESSRVAAYEPRTGKLSWECKGLPRQVFATPAVGDGVLVAMGHNIPAGTKVMAVRLGGSGDVSKTHRLWEVDLPKEYIGSGVIAQGYVFLVAEHGFVLCLDLKTGEKVWEKRLPGGRGSWSSIVLANGRLLAANQAGRVSIFAGSPKYELIGTNAIPAETTCSSPAVAGGRVFLRTHDALWCFAGPATEQGPKRSE